MNGCMHVCLNAAKRENQSIYLHKTYNKHINKARCRCTQTLAYNGQVSVREATGRSLAEGERGRRSSRVWLSVRFY